MSPTYRVRIQTSDGRPFGWILDGDSNVPREWASYDEAVAFADRLNDAARSTVRRRYVVEAPGCEW